MKLMGSLVLFSIRKEKQFLLIVTVSEQKLNFMSDNLMPYLNEDILLRNHQCLPL